MKGQSTCTALLHAYMQNKELMKQMSVRGLLRCPLPFNHMLALYIAIGALDKVEEMVKELKKYATTNELTYNLWLTACANTNEIIGAEKIFEDMKEKRLAADWVTYSILTSIYIKTTKLNRAKEALDETEKRVSRKERTAYSFLISLHESLSDRENVYRIWGKMKLMFRKMSDVEYKCMLSSLPKLGDIEQDESIYEEWARDSRVPSILLAFYVKKKMIQKAEGFHARTLKAGIEPSYSTWELMAWGHVGGERITSVQDCLKKEFSCLENGSLTLEL